MRSILDVRPEELDLALATRAANEGNLRFSSRTMEDLTLTGDLSNSTFDGCTFTNCYFSGAVLAQSYLQDCTFVNCDLSGTDLSNCDLTDASFEGCTLTRASLSEAIGKYTSFEKCDLSGANMSAEWRGSAFTFCEFSVMGHFATFYGATVLNSCFKFCDLNSVEMALVDLSGTKFHHCSLANADLTRVCLDASIIDGCNLEGAQVNGSHVIGVDFTRTSLWGLAAVRTTFQSCDLSGQRLSGGVFMDSTFSDCDLTNILPEGSEGFEQGLPTDAYLDERSRNTLA